MGNSKNNDNQKSSCSERIKKVMKMRGINQKQLAEFIGVTPQSISYYCKGTRHPDVNVLRDIAKCLNVSADYLLGLERESVIAIREKLSEEQAKEFAYAFLSAIPSYIESHKDEYWAYLVETGQTDKYYQNKCEKENK